ncbi:flagellar export protein FliJ [Pelotomaculum isophthalicicum JI]|uniref:Flagellar FliJ protein n=1 Tax=Pelotomaculum isophthalicicum JI TaxID=947010 RepID=A0A9X4H536_9FIRM|nr:flagellar export protein FliJ [Pelotomaculum isophthalicicum JI]
MRHRAAKEVSAEQALAMAHHEYNRRLAMLENTRQRLEAAFDVAEEDADVLGVAYLSFYRASLNKKIDIQEKDVSNAGLVVESRRNAAVRARQERQVIEMLKDKHLMNYKREVAAREQKEVDELALYAYQRRLDNL